MDKTDINTYIYGILENASISRTVKDTLVNFCVADEKEKNTLLKDYLTSKKQTVDNQIQDLTIVSNDLDSNITAIINKGGII